MKRIRQRAISKIFVLLVTGVLLLLTACTDVIVITNSPSQAVQSTSTVLEPTSPSTFPEGSESPIETDEPDIVEFIPESPYLMERIQSGILPEYNNRLPVMPFVSTNGREDAVYGGRIRWGYINDPIWTAGLYFIAWESLLAWNNEYSSVIPNIAEKVEISQNSSVFTFSIREGIKWSDGTPFTTRDIEFYLEDILYDPDVNAGGPITDWLPYDMATQFRYEIIDPLHIRFIFPRPYSKFLLDLPSLSGIELTAYPAHYCSQFHIKYNANVADIVRSNPGTRDWVDLLNNKCGIYGSWFTNVNKPTLFAWIVSQSSPKENILNFQRNPYYWKLDLYGRQLPYIDEIQAVKFDDQTGLGNALANGTIDFAWNLDQGYLQHFLDAAASGSSTNISTMLPESGNTATIHFNRTIADQQKSELFARKEFRVGVSHALNRQLIINNLLGGVGKPSQAAPSEDSVLYIQRLAEQFLEYDPGTANFYLDQVIPVRDQAGYRLMPDGSRVSITLTVINNLPWTSWHPALAAIIVDNLSQVGIEVFVDSRSEGEVNLSKKKNEIEAFIYLGDGGVGLSAILKPQNFVPMEFWGVFGNGWYYWAENTPGSVRVEPPEEILNLRLQFEQEVIGTNYGPSQITAMRGILDLAADNFWVIGISRPGAGHLPYNNRIANLPDSWILSRSTGGVKMTSPESWFIP